MAFLVQEKSGLGVSAVAKLKEHHIMCAEELARNQSVRKIASTFDVDESTLRYRLGRKRTGAVDGRAQQPEACAPYEPVILEWIRSQEERQPGTRPEPIRVLYETLQMEHGYTGSYKAVIRYVRRRTAQPEVQPFRRVETRPGAQAQVDWLQKRVYIHSLGGFTKLSAFVMTLSHSRMWVVIWSRSEDMLAWLDGHNRAFEFLGGVPFFVRLDNLKTGVASGCGAWAKINDGYEILARSRWNSRRTRTGSTPRGTRPCGNLDSRLISRCEKKGRPGSELVQFGLRKRCGYRVMFSISSCFGQL